MNTFIELTEHDIHHEENQRLVIVSPLFIAGIEPGHELHKQGKDGRWYSENKFGARVHFQNDNVEVRESVETVYRRAKEALEKMIASKK